MREPDTGVSRRTVLKNGALLAGAVVVGGTGTAVAGVGDGRVAHYTLNNIHMDRDTEEKIRNLVFDASPYRNHGTWEGDESDPVVKDGAVGKAYAFDGNDYVAVANHPSLVFGDGSNDEPFSVSAWVKIAAEENGFVVGKGRTVGSLEYLLNVDTEREWAQFRMYDGGGGNTIRRRVDYPTTYSGEWHHVAGTYDGSGSASGISVYVDGVEPATVDTLDQNYTAMADRGDDVELGAILRDESSYGGYLNGSLDEVRIYDRVLSSDEVVELAAMGE